MGNDPVNNVDPDGGTAIAQAIVQTFIKKPTLTPFLSDPSWGGSGSTSTTSSSGGSFGGAMANAAGNMIAGIAGQWAANKLFPLPKGPDAGQLQQSAPMQKQVAASVSINNTNPDYNLILVQYNEVYIEDGLLHGSGVIQDLDPVLKRPHMKAGVTAIVLHRTVTDNSEQAVRSWKATKGRKGFAHVVVDKDGTITQVANFEDRANHVGEKKNKLSPSNYNSVGIETVGNYNYATKTWDPVTPAQIKVVAHLVNLLMDYYHLTPQNIYTHEDLADQTPGEGGDVKKEINDKIEQPGSIKSWFQRAIRFIKGLFK